MTENKSWYAVITAEVLYAEDLNPRQKLLMAVISNLSNEKGYCFATNGRLGELVGAHKVTISTDIKELEERGFLTSAIHLKPNGEIDFRALTPLSHRLTPLSHGLRPLSHGLRPIITNTITNLKDTPIVPKGTTVNSDDVESVYQAYPSKCPVTKRPLGKSSKDKLRIQRLLKRYTAQDLTERISAYVAESKQHNVYMKNFATFLNNIPEKAEETKETRTELKPEQRTNLNGINYVVYKDEEAKRIYLDYQVESINGKFYAK